MNYFTVIVINLLYNLTLREVAQKNHSLIISNLFCNMCCIIIYFCLINGFVHAELILSFLTIVLLEPQNMSILQKVVAI